MWWKGLLTCTKQLISKARRNGSEKADSPSTLQPRERELRKESVQEAPADLVAPRQPCTYRSSDTPNQQNDSAALEHATLLLKKHVPLFHKAAEKADFESLREDDNASVSVKTKQAF